MFDLVIRGGTVLDGTGAQGRRADVGIRDGRIAAIGDIEGQGGLDATGLIVAPGFVDLHTHYDAQLFWDPSASPSPLHGVTTVFGGNCGFSLAPAGPGDATYLTSMLARVEGMPLAALEASLGWEWDSFGSWLDMLDGTIGINAGFMAGHSTIRRTVMGDEAGSREATAAEVAAMVEALHQALSEGAMGFSTSQSHTHHDGAGEPVPSRAAARSELEALAAVLRDHPGTAIELVLSGSLNGFSPDEVDLMATMSRLADRTVNWNVLGVSALDPDGAQRQLAASDEDGASVVALTLPHTMRIRLSFETGVILDGLPGWREIMALSTDARIAALSDPATRRRMDDGAQSDEAGILRHLAVWHRLIIEETFAPECAAYEGRTVGDVARTRGQEPFDALLDVVVADRLRTGFRPPIPESNDDWRLRAEVWHDPRAIVGGSDAGAHLDTMCGAVYSTSLLGYGVRERELLSFEEALRLLTDVPARFYGVTGRGRIEPGYFADLALFDPETVGPGPERTRNDLPTGASRLFAGAEGIPHVFVNGTAVVRDGEPTGALPGSVIRSGRDTETVRAGSAWRDAQRPSPSE